MNPYLKKKQSPNCRAEAEYAFNLRKPIIPLILQKNYMPDGWLGIILGAKIFINFSKYDFDECMRKLKVEIKNVVASTTTTSSANNNNIKPEDSIKQNVPSLGHQVSKEKVQKIKSWKNEVKKIVWQ